MARFVLVHGAWHGGWCFAELAAELELGGHDVWAPDLPCDDVTKTQHDYAALLGDCSDAVVVGHSLGGLTVGLVDAAVHVYLAPILPIENAFAGAFAEGFGGFVRDDEGRSYWADASTAAERLYPDCTRAQADWAYSKLRPQSRLEPVAGPIGPRDVLIATTRDAAVDFDWQVRTGHESGLRVLELDAGHFPFFTHPGELADMLSSVA
jgi:pimeloyl-ACP methyl ester carboxylesterase